MNRSFGEGLAYPLGFVAEVFRRDRVLAWTGALMLLQAVAALALMPLDHRTILGLDPWIKPFKFSVSIAIFLWTLAWILPTLRASRRVKSFFSWGFAICMVVEIACIAGQSARGVRSHFNFETGFDGLIHGSSPRMVRWSSGMSARAAAAWRSINAPVQARTRSRRKTSATKPSGYASPSPKLRFI